MRKAEFVTSSEKPAAKYLEWASEQGKFKYYDKAKGENVLIDMPRFLGLMQFHTVKGWNDASQSGIWSNEVKLIGTQEMEVKSFKGGVIARGLYKDIKERITAAGGHYVKSVYILVGEEIYNLQLKGAVVQEWGEAFNKCQNRFADEWVIVDTVDKRKKGRVEYTVPVFKFKGVIDNDTAKLADEKSDELAERLKMRDEDREEIRNTTKMLQSIKLNGEVAQAHIDDHIASECLASRNKLQQAGQQGRDERDAEQGTQSFQAELPALDDPASDEYRQQ